MLSLSKHEAVFVIARNPRKLPPQSVGKRRSNSHNIKAQAAKFVSNTPAQSGRGPGGRILRPMQPDPTSRITPAGLLADGWRMLRDWLGKAQAEFAASSSTIIARGQARALKRCVFFIEGLLRRFVLVGAALWCGPLAPQAPARPALQPTSPKRLTTGAAFRLFAIYRPPTPRAPTPRVICLDDKFTAARLAPRQPPKTALPAWMGDPLLNAGYTKPEAAPAPFTPGPLRGTVIRHEADLEPYIPLRDRWTYDPGAEPVHGASRAWRPHTNHAPIINWREMPETVSAAALFARLANAAKLVASPERLIRRAARLIARRRQLAHLLAHAKDPMPRGSIKASWSGEGVPALHMATRFLRGVLNPPPAAPNSS